MKGSYQEAIECFEKKDYQSTKDILTNLKERDESNPDILYFLAVVKSITEDYAGAETLYKKVIKIKPAHTEACYNLALCLHNQDKKEEALIYYQKAVELDPFLSEAYNNLAVVYKELERFEEAETAFKKAVKIKPGNSNAVSNLSNLSLNQESSDEFRKAFDLFQEKDFEGARDILVKLLEKNPDSIHLNNALGTIYFNLKSYDKSIKCYEKVLSINENDSDAYYSLGVCYQYSDNNKLALENYKKAAELNPGNLGALNNLGLLSLDSKNNDDAEKYYRMALEVNPDYAFTLLNLGGLKLGTDKFEEALEYYHKALKVLLKDNNDFENITKAYTNIGVVHLRRQNINEALNYFNLALETDPQSTLAHYNKAEALLITKQFDEGWKEYEWRIERKDFGNRKFDRAFGPQVDLHGKRVLVFAEQGLGDAIQFVRYLPMLKEKGCYIIFECGKEIHSLLNRFEGIDMIIDRKINIEPDIEYDYAIPLLSLPLYFKTNINNIPSGTRYLKADAELRNRWSQIIKDGDKIKIGIVWAGNPSHSNDRQRSARLRHFINLLSIEGTHFYSLQKGFPVIQAKDYQLLLTDLDEHIKSFADTAAIIENLDLVITVDTSVAHLAGALGKETWLLLPFFPDWRWMLYEDKSPWYPSIKLYRQPAIYDWNSVFKILKNDLEDFVLEKRKIKTKDVSFKKNEKAETIYLGLTSGENFGWGVCSKYLKKELSQKLNIINFDEHPELVKSGMVNGPVFHALNNNDFNGLFPVRGTKNIGYTFFEYELNEAAIKKALNYDLVLGGSSWNEKKLRERGVNNTGVLIQGVDPELFYPSDKETKRDLFVIFSGGKFELRKGQDLVLRAIKILQQKYRDIVLINAWYNMWPSTMQSMGMSKHIKYEYKGETWKNFMINLCTINGIDGDKVLTLPITPNNKLRDLYLSTDIGLFPNRCEGGTNLVLMEYMACGKPVIASYTSGHTDILTDENSLPLTHMKEFKLYDDNKNLFADWEEPDIDEIIAKIEYAYFNRENIKQIGKKAGEFMKSFTWKASAETLMKYFVH